MVVGNGQRCACRLRDGSGRRKPPRWCPRQSGCRGRSAIICADPSRAALICPAAHCPRAVPAGVGDGVMDPLGHPTPPKAMHASPRARPNQRPAAGTPVPNGPDGLARAVEGQSVRRPPSSVQSYWMLASLTR